MIMQILDLFSKRQRKIRGEVPDVLTYETLPHALRVQIVHILTDTLGNETEAAPYGAPMVAQAYEYVVDSLCREYGVFRLPGERERRDRHYLSELFNFILSEKSVEKVLDAVELSFGVVDVHSRKWEYKTRHHDSNPNMEADAGLAELNARFLEHGIGFRYEAGEIIRVDSEVIHAEVVKPALTLLHHPAFAGAEAEFHRAFEHYRHGRMKEALAECLKSLESTIKSIAAKRKWKHERNATVKPLIDLMYEKQVIPQLWSQHFSGLRSMLESGVPTARNRLGGHGQGVEPVTVPEHYVAFALHQTAAAIVFLANAERELP